MYTKTFKVNNFLFSQKVKMQKFANILFLIYKIT